MCAYVQTYINSYIHTDSRSALEYFAAESRLLIEP